jgi:heme exporter protein B
MSGSNALARIWAVCAKDAAQEARRRIALASVLFFAATALTLVSFAIGPAGFAREERGQLHAAMLWVLLFFSSATGLPRAFVREEETGTALALRKTAPGTLVLAGKTLFNYFLFVAIAAVTVPGLGILLGWEVASPAAMSLVLAASGYGLTVVSTFLSALVARAGQKNVLFVLVCFPLLVPLLLSSIAATVAAAAGELAGPPMRVILAYDGAATCAAYLLAAAAWEE